MYHWLLSRFSISATGAKRSEIRELLKLTQQPGIISFAGGLPSPDTFPRELIADLSREVILSDGEWALQYGPTEGLPVLKEEIIKIVAQDGIRAKPENILITNASQQGLDLVSRVFLNRRNRVIVGRPSYVGALGAFKNSGATFQGIDVDDQGIQVDQVGRCLNQLRLKGDLPKFIYVIPDFQNPAGVTLSLERRRKLLKLAREFKVLIIEDSPYRALRYVGKTLPSFYELDAGKGYVISLFTFSKILFPGLRLGWMLANEELIEKFVMTKQAMDLCTPTLTQAVASTYCRRGHLKAQIAGNVSLYRKKRSVMLDALAQYMPEHPEIVWTKPEGGLFLWICLPKFLNTERLFQKALDKKVAYVIGNSFYVDGGGQNAMRLNFSYPSEEQIEEGIKRLAGVIEDSLGTEKP